MKKIIIFYGGFKRFGGVYSHVINTSNEFAKLNWEVQIITLDNLPFLIKFIPHLFERLINSILCPLGFYYKGLITRFFYKYFFNYKCDLIIFEDIYITFNSTIPSLTFIHAVWSDNLQSFKVNEELKYSLIFKESNLINSICHNVVTVSNEYKYYLSTNHFYNSINKKIDVIELGIQNVLLNKNLSRSFNSLVYVGSLEKRKNIFFLLAIFEKLTKLDCSYKLTIIGDGPEKNELIRYVKIRRLNVVFLGALNNENVIDELNKNRIYIHTSTKESFSYALLEAKLCGLITFAYTNLEVPRSFIDVKLNTFEIDEWVNTIHTKSKMNISFFDSTKFTSSNMVNSILNLIK